ncbi:MAG: peptidylprolyl isomerase [Ketobacteraceae bacterium]|nr:peptidylprolyl isomerase [Ketobacteraceae bacterium]
MDIACVVHAVILRPLLFFLIIGVSLWSGDYLWNALRDSGEPAGQVLVSEQAVDRLKQRFYKERLRQATPEELGAMIEAFVLESVLMKEALRLGIHLQDPVVAQRIEKNVAFLGARTEQELLDTMLANDPVIKGRLLERMQALLFSQWQANGSESAMKQRISAYYQDNKDRYRSERRFRLDHQWQTAQGATLSFVGPGQMLSLSNLEKLLPEGLVAQLDGSAAGQTFRHAGQGGVHQVRILEIVPPSSLPLARVEARVAMDYQAFMRKQLTAAYAEEMCRFYDILLPVQYRSLVKHKAEAPRQELANL